MNRVITNRAEALEALDVEIVEVGHEYELRDNSMEVVNKIFDSIDEMKKKMIMYIEDAEVLIDADRGNGETLEELIERDQMPKLWHELKGEEA